MTARAATDYCTTVGGDGFTRAGGLHLVLYATARVCSSQIHVVELAYHTLNECQMGDVGPAEKAIRRHATEESI